MGSKGTITLRYETIPCLKMQTAFLEALRPLKRLCLMNS